ncbi:hypothetical protein PT974_04273 [Cladobotryum mycophilum]|uniref:Uncharacterized protein n=1 Tax=Cladobotryum mycophilum TaxID=491253 RepID=A0ABR0SVR7_9HYPO
MQKCPPANSGPEAANFPSTRYEMSKDTAQFDSQGQYHYQAPPPIFPWEGHQPKPTRSFFGDPQPSQAPALSALVTAAREPQPAAREPPAAVREIQPAPREYREPQYEREPQSPTTAPSTSEMDTMDNQSEAVTPTTPTRFANANPWTAYPHINAWDDVPGINRYVEGFERYRRSSVKSLKGVPVTPRPTNPEDGVHMRGTKVTDFPSEVERPSLPVTPAPVRRSSFWSQGGSEAENDGRALPAAEGVPVQSEWDPTEQLQKLAAQQSEALLRRLGGKEEESDIPSRPLSYGSGDVVPIAHVSQSVPKLLSPRPVKGAAAVTTTSLERKMQKAEPDYSEPRQATWDEDEATEFSYQEREALEA